MRKSKAATTETGRIKTRFYPARPNPMFPDEVTALLRFAIPTKPIVCAACGRPSKKLWTMLCSFSVARSAGFMLKMGAERAALTLVCSEHPLNPTDAVMQAAMCADVKLAPQPDVADPEIKPGDFSFERDEDDDNA